MRNFAEPAEAKRLRGITCALFCRCQVQVVGESVSPWICELEMGMTGAVQGLLFMKYCWLTQLTVTTSDIKKVMGSNQLPEFHICSPSY